jgi:predicted nucleic acid-binding Zn ribbon protein
LSQDKSAVRLNDSLAQVFGSLKGNSVLMEVIRNWEEIAGAELSEKLYPARIKGDTLVILATGSQWAALARYHYSDLLASIAKNPTLSVIKNIKILLKPEAFNF